MGMNAETLELRAHAEGCILPVRAQPGARREGVVGPHGGALKVAVRAAREKGKANKAIAGVLAATLGIRQADVTLLSGAAAPDKRFLVHGLGTEEVRSRLNKVDGV